MTDTDPWMPAADCHYGFPLAQIEQLIGPERMEEFCEWTTGRTGVICDGRVWNPMSQAYDPTNCGPHGAVVYRRDVRRFLARGPA